MCFLSYVLPIFASENSGQISIGDSNTECMQIEFEIKNRSSKIRTWFNIPNYYYYYCYYYYYTEVDSHKFNARNHVKIWQSLSPLNGHIFTHTLHNNYET